MKNTIARLPRLEPLPKPEQQEVANIVLVPDPQGAIVKFNLFGCMEIGILIPSVVLDRFFLERNAPHGRQAN